MSGFVCTGCTLHDEEPTRCRETFVCSVCHQRRNSCTHLVGDLDAQEKVCDVCFCLREFGAEWVQRYNAKAKGRPKKKTATDPLSAAEEV